MTDTPKRYRPQHAKYQREWRAKNLEKVREYEREKQRQYRAAGQGNFSPSAKARRAEIKYNHARNRALLAARPKPETCDVCGGGGRIVFDHCHKTNNFRGWLCDPCNRALGAIHDNANRLRQLAAYLERTRDGQGAQLNIPGL